MKRSINHAFSTGAVLVASCLLVMGASGVASADAKGRPAGAGAQASTSTAATGTSATPQGSAADHSHGNAGTSGDASSPQPVSKADQHGGGANGKCPGGPYCSTRDGSPSLNGNGGGRAVGKPCAGCVGKADNKNPRGQYPNGSDHNAGYECDRNHGIGRTNPAHTGCAGSSVPPPGGCVENPATPGDDCSVPPPGGCVDNPATPGDDCSVPPPGGCVENPATPGPDCGPSFPPGGCVENPATPGDDCSVPPPGGCVENPLTPGPDCDSSTPPSTGCCTLVSPPSAAAPPAGSTLVPSVGRPGRTQAGVLPATGAPANVAALLLASGLLLSGGVLVLRRTRPAR